MIGPPGSEQIQFPGFLDRMNALVYLQLAINALDVRLDRIQAEKELPANFFVAQSPGQVLQHLQFTRAQQSLVLLFDLGSCRASAESVQQTVGVCSHRRV